MRKKGKKSPLTGVVIAGALVIALILQGAILRRKIHRLEEERL